MPGGGMPGGGLPGGGLPLIPPEAAGAPPGIPEPATWVMMMTGIFGVGAVLRGRRASQRQASRLKLTETRKPSSIEI